MELTTTDYKTLISIIDICAQRGAFKGDELFSVGTLYVKLVTQVSNENNKVSEIDNEQ